MAIGTVAEQEPVRLAHVLSAPVVLIFSTFVTWIFMSPPPGRLDTAHYGCRNQPCEFPVLLIFSTFTTWIFTDSPFIWADCRRCQFAEPQVYSACSATGGSCRLDLLDFRDLDLHVTLLPLDDLFSSSRNDDRRVGASVARQPESRPYS